MSDPGRLHGLSVIALKSTSRTERPSNMPTALGSILGAEGGAVAGGRVDVSIPSSGSLTDTESRREGTDDACGGPPLDIGVYSVVNDSPAAVYTS